MHACRHACCSNWLLHAALQVWPAAAASRGWLQAGERRQPTLPPRACPFFSLPPCRRMEEQEGVAKGPLEALADTLKGAADYVK